jgi:hypothetical protein
MCIIQVCATMHVASARTCSRGECCVSGAGADTDAMLCVCARARSHTHARAHMTHAVVVVAGGGGGANDVNGRLANGDDTAGDDAACGSEGTACRAGVEAACASDVGAATLCDEP